MSSITYKDSYVMYKNWSKGIIKLSDAQAGQLLKSICAFQDGEETEPDDVAAAALFEIFKDRMIEDAEAYKAKCDRLKENLSSQKENENCQKGNDKSQMENKKSQMGKNKSQKGNEKDQKDAVASVSVSLSDTDTVPDSKKDKEKKESYGELGNVKLTVKERERLIEDYGSAKTEAAIDYLDGYIADKGYKSKSNYQAIRRWVIDAIDERGRASPGKQPEKFDLDAYLREKMEDTG